MFSFLKQPERTLEEKQRRFNELFKKLVPPSYEAETLQGELLRCIGNLSDEAKRNGNENWDEADEEAIEFLIKNLADPDVFDAAAIAKIRTDLDAIRKAGRSTEGDFCTALREIDRIADRVVDFCDAHPKLIRFKKEEDYRGHF
jgi:hypothetical protein